MFVVRPFVRLGDPHIHGGTVIKVGQTRYDIDAIKVACLGDMVICPIPGHGVCKIVQCQDSAFIDGKPAAVLGSLTACGAVLIPTQFYAGLAPLAPPAALPEYGDHEDLLQPTHETDLQAMDVLLDYKRSPAQTPPACLARVHHFQSEGEAYGCEAKYSQREMVRNAVRTREGTAPPPKVYARIAQTTYLQDDNELGKKDQDGAVRVWLADPDHIEHCGDDAEKIFATLGLDYDPQKNYSMTLFDAELLKEASPGAKLFVPTFDEVCSLCQGALKRYFSERKQLPDVLTKEYAQLYDRVAAVVPDLSAIGPDQMKELAQELNVEEAKLHGLRARSRVEKEIGANRHFMGNGLTKLSRGDEPLRYGAGEVYLYDRQPLTIGQYKAMPNGEQRLITIPLRKRTTV